MVLPLSQPIKALDGSMNQEIPVPKDTMIAIGVLSSNTNKALWGEDALEWKPERWLGKSPDEVANVRYPGVYSSM